jgi:hypothetical protein
VVIEHAGLARGDVRVVDLGTGQETAVPLAALMAAPSRALEPTPGGALA